MAEENDDDELDVTASLEMDADILSVFGELEGFGKKGPKNPKNSARQKYNRRKRMLAHALEQTALSIEALYAQDGTVYKKAEADELLKKIRELQALPTLPDPNEGLDFTPEENDHLLELLTSSGGWQPPTDEDMQKLQTIVEEARKEAKARNKDAT